MARHKDANWNLADHINAPGIDAGLLRRQVALLMDIRDELKSLNALLHCANFQQIPQVLRSIRRKIPTRTRRRKA